MTIPADAAFDPTLARASELALTAWNVGMVAAADGQVHSTHGLTCAYHPQPFALPGAHHTLHLTPAADLTAGLDAAHAFYRERGSAIWCILGNALAPTDARAALKARGWRYHFAGISMAADLDSIPERPTPPGVTITPATAQTFAHAEAHPYYGKLTDAHAAQSLRASLALTAERPTRAWNFVALSEGQPIASALMILIGGELAGIFDVGTLPGYQRRGIVSAVIRAALHHARDLGYRTAVLQCDAPLVRVYGPLGFRQVGWLAHWVYPAPADIPAHTTSSADTALEDLLSAINTNRPATALNLLRTQPALARASQPNGATALHHAAITGQPVLVQALLEAGAPLDAVETNDGCTPLLWATAGAGDYGPQIKTEQAAAAELLIRAGANPHATNHWDETAFDLAPPAVADHLRTLIAAPAD